MKLHELFLNIFKMPLPLDQAIQELIESERSLLEAQSAQEYANAIILYRTTQSNRLRLFIQENTKNKEGKLYLTKFNQNLEKDD